jgi:hypothetical protein
MSEKVYCINCKHLKEYHNLALGVAEYECSKIVLENIKDPRVHPPDDDSGYRVKMKVTLNNNKDNNCKYYAAK